MVHTPQTDSNSIDAILFALADEHRRLAIRYLREVPDATASPEELAEYITTHSSGELTPSEVAIRLHHANLPKLADADIIEYDSRSETVRYRPTPLVENVLATIKASSDSSPNS